MAAPATAERHITHICEMMQRLGIEPGGGVIPHLALSYATAFRRCKMCGTREACRKWLDCTSASNGLAPRFCPNADIFFELRLEAPASGCEVAHGLAATTGKPADISDLERLEDEIDQALIDLINKPADNKTTIDDLRRRQTHLRGEIDGLRHGAAEKVPH